MDISKYNVKDTTKCECGHEFDIHEINGLQTIINHGFFSNIVRTCSVINCPKCKKETVLLLKQKGQTWEILAIATKEIPKVGNKIVKQSVKPMKIENNKEKETSQELICPICKKSCKSKLGLNAHMRTHNK